MDGMTKTEGIGLLVGSMGGMPMIGGVGLLKSIRGITKIGGVWLGLSMLGRLRGAVMVMSEGKSTCWQFCPGRGWLVNSWPQRHTGYAGSCAHNGAAHKLAKMQTT